MRTRRSALILVVLAALVVPSAPASAATAAAAACSTDRAAQVLERHKVKYPKRFRATAGMVKENGKRFCLVSAWDDNSMRVLYTAKVSKNGKVLYATAVERTTKKSWSRTEDFTRAGRKHFSVKAARTTEKSSSKKVKGGQNTKETQTFRNANGSTGSRVFTRKDRGAKVTNRVTIVLKTAKKKRTKVTIKETVRFAARVTVKGSMTSTLKKYRGSYHVTLKERRSQGLLVSQGLAGSGTGKTVYNRVVKLESARFGAARNGYVRGLI